MPRKPCAVIDARAAISSTHRGESAAPPTLLLWGWRNGLGATELTPDRIGARIVAKKSEICFAFPSPL
jgi:hypothetical protein